MQFDTAQYQHITGTSIQHDYNVTYTQPTTGSNRLLIICITYGPFSTLSNVNWNGTAMTQIAHKSLQGNQQIDMYAILNPDTGTHDLTYHDVNVNSIFGVTFGSYYSVLQSSQPDVFTTTSTALTPHTYATTTDYPQCWVLIACSDDGQQRTSTSSITVRAEAFPATHSGMLFGDSGGMVPVGTYNQTISTSGGNYSTITAAFKPDQVTYPQSMFSVF